MYIYINYFFKERDRMLNVFVDKLKEKYNEIDDLNTQLESNTQVGIFIGLYTKIFF